MLFQKVFLEITTILRAELSARLENEDNVVQCIIDSGDMNVTKANHEKQKDEDWNE